MAQVEQARMAGLRATLQMAHDEISGLMDHVPGEDNPDDMLWLWYARGETVVRGIWVAGENEYEDGDGAWSRDITGMVLPSSPPWLELAFHLPECEVALREMAAGTGPEAEQLRHTLALVARERAWQRLAWTFSDLSDTMTQADREEVLVETERLLGYIRVLIGQEATTAVQATVIDHDPQWQEPVIPVVAGITGWSIVEDDGFARWFARPGEVVLGMWSHDYEWPGRSEDEIVATDAPAFEVTLPLSNRAGTLDRLLRAGGCTLAVLEFGGGEDEPPTWGVRWVGADGLAEAAGEAGEDDEGDR